MRGVMANQLIKPAWLTYPSANIYTGLSGRTIERRVADGTLVTTYIRPPGAKRGRRLISRESIDKWLESGIGDCQVIPAGATGNRKGANAR
jgi:hypothetical protein